MKTYTIAILVVFAVLGAHPVLAEEGAHYTSNPYSYGPSHNNYNGKVKYGSSTNNYNGYQKYSSAPKTGSPTMSYMSSNQALSNSVPY